MEEVLDSNLAKEILTVLPYLEDSFLNSIPSEFIENITSLAADSDKNFYIMKNKNLNEQHLSHDCKNMLSLLYYEYVDADEQTELINIWKNNDNN